MDTEKTTNTPAEDTMSKGEQRRKEKEKAIRIAKIKKATPWALFIIIVIGGLYWVVTNTEKRSESRPGEAVAIQGADHIAVNAEHEPYNSNPPTSGPHANAVPWGFYEEEIADENAVHNLEHGGIWITYKDIDETALQTLKDIAQQNKLSVIVSPRTGNDGPITLASWGRLETLDSVDKDTIDQFIRKNKNQSPERLAR